MEKARKDIDVIAVDFDGTIVEHSFPEIGNELLGAIETLKDLQKVGYWIVLWTVRNGYYLKQAVDFLSQEGFVPNEINKSTYLNIKYHNGSLDISAKVWADVYLDDKNFNGFPGWDVIRREFLT